jgi:uncharacterized membrane protein HdeD (DUF308 family)
MDYLTIYLITPLLVGVLATTSAVMKVLEKKWEGIIPRLLLATVYFYSYFTPLWSQNERQFFVRWSVALLLIVEIITMLIFAVRRNSKYIKGWWERKS